MKILVALPSSLIGSRPARTGEETRGSDTSEVIDQIVTQDSGTVSEPLRMMPRLGVEQYAS